MIDDCGVATGRWLDVVRRARMGSAQRKLCALTLASYANADGRGVYVGVHRLALDMECGTANVQRCLRWLRDVGLIERTARGHWRHGTHDTYRLILGPQLLDKVDLPNPDEYRALKIKASEAQGARRKRSRLALSTPVDDLWTTDHVGTSRMDVSTSPWDITQVMSHPPHETSPG